jgi:serine/threonine protein kinase
VRSVTSVDGFRSDIDDFMQESAVEMAVDHLQAPTLLDGQLVGPYRVQRLLSTGGMGEVYQARDTRPELDRAVAIKVLLPHLFDQLTLRERFERETRPLAALSHPHICRVFDVGHHDDVDFIVMEYVEGDTLAARLDRGALTIDEALEIGMQIASALHAAHRAGIVHRDLKPANVMISSTGAKLLDFGLASDGAPGPVSRNSRAPAPILGTIQHMAPEQIEGHAVDARADVFGLGVVLYEMLTGKKPFIGRSQAGLIAAILKDQPVPPSALSPHRSSRLDRIVGKCLAKDPDERWQTAKELWDELRCIVADLQTARTRRREAVADDRWICLAGIALVVAIAAGGWTLCAYSRQKGQHD